MPRIASFLLLITLPLAAQSWRRAESPLETRWAAEVSPENALPEYPRPQLRREVWTNLNGLWDYAITDRGAPAPAQWKGKILVPFAIESGLSGVKEPVSPEQALWYRRTLEVPEVWRSQRVLLHFGAVDWQAEVWLNGVRLGEHRGGYVPFSFDLSSALVPGVRQELLVRVWDPTDTGEQARGKQVLEPKGIWYTAVTGIWQTVWMEPVGSVSIERLNPTPDIDAGELRLAATLSGPTQGLSLRAVASDGGKVVAEARGGAGEPLTLKIPNAKLWSPDSPHLYDLAVELLEGGSVLDKAESYFGMREIALGRDGRGDLRMELNGKALFQFGPLDQGWWPDGLYTAPTDEALAYDIQATKDLGFNMARKHVKVEPARWYYHCDRLGLLVWQDMPSGYLGRGVPRGLFVQPWDAEDGRRDGVSGAQFEGELQEMIDNFRMFPSIVAWVPFNEGWGQYDTARVAGWVKQYDPTRLVNASSGWTDRGAGDVYDTHMYPGPGLQFGGEKRAAVLGEFGGLGWPVEDHLWWDKRNWGYRTYYSREDLLAKYQEVVGELMGPLAWGMAAAVYTQTTDVEGEVNGLMTYDRKLVKFDADALHELHAPLYQNPPRPRVLLPAAHAEPQPWRYAVKKPRKGWEDVDFKDRRWAEGRAPFREEPDPIFTNGTVWNADQIWIRREFDVDRLPQNLWLEIQHTLTQGEVFLNGVKIDDLERFSRREYRHQNVSEHLDALRVGRNVLAIHAAPGEEDRGFPNSLDAGLYGLE
ncbi:MAG: beta-galactosidase [Acidobacteria bacterium]|nr:beta-galactosidase [Acidobacteriota bacterium]